MEEIYVTNDLNEAANFRQNLIIQGVIFHEELKEARWVKNQYYSVFSCDNRFYAEIAREVRKKMFGS